MDSRLNLKKVFCALTVFVTVITFGFCQTIYEDFEGGAIQNWVAVDGEYFGQEPNNFPGGDNTSSGVGAYKKGVPAYSLFLTTLSSAMDLISNNQFTIQIYSPVPSAIIMKLESDTGPDIEDIKTISAINEWVQYNFDFSAAANYSDLTKIVLFFNPGVTNMEDTYLFDYITASTTLPVSLIGFNVSYDANDKRADLKWTTAQEINNDRFEIQHSYNGGAWESIASVKGAGTTTREMEYNISLPVSRSGHHGFRLKQIDFDGSYDISVPKNLHVKPTHFKIYPTLTTDNLTIESAGDAMIRLLGINGSEVLRWNVSEGINTFDIYNLEKGTYILTDINGKLVERIFVH